MNGFGDRHDVGDECDEFEDLDDTLADGPSPASVPEEAREWLAEQRSMHGLLRALHTADASAREGRVAAILGRVDRDTVEVRRRHWTLVAAAALVFAVVGVWAALPSSLPKAEAAMARAVGELGREIDRRFHVRTTMVGEQREVVRHDFDLVARPGQRFLIDGRFRFAGLRMARGRVGCDGSEFWVLSNNSKLRRSGPLAERERLLEGLGDVLDLGYIDVHALVEKLPGKFVLRTVARETNADGRRQLRIRAKRRRGRGPAKLRRAELLVDEATGMVTHYEIEMRVGPRMVRRVEMEYLGEATPGTVDYKKPW